MLQMLSANLFTQLSGSVFQVFFYRLPESPSHNSERVAWFLFRDYVICANPFCLPASLEKQATKGLWEKRAPAICLTLQIYHMSDVITIFCRCFGSGFFDRRLQDAPLGCCVIIYFIRRHQEVISLVAQGQLNIVIHNSLWKCLFFFL